ncbi:dienelactone hydrolase family protein [Nocardia macrotermitis]|uniref:Dienelactone hydrolase domain-containing protein n=1 Tax=Nocardia macrotermitis TaxID=2585198 RepID=A0A7K0DCK9_9NOCA|nr:dienelactone hydrolase family protein [Nocardia macrotermitis]MQY22614.1 hypothetical protein [Nocardia macrotermitis]
MCFDEDAVPPIPADPDASIVSRDLELVAADGNRFAAFVAEPEGDTETAVVVLPDLRGLYGFYTELAKRFAERGIRAIVIDYYGRSAGVAQRAKDFPYAEHLATLNPRGIYADLAAAVEYLRSPEGGSSRFVLTAGFCIGGRIAVLAATGPIAPAGVIGFYCWPAAGNDGAPGPTARAAELRAPVLALMAGDDPGIPAADVEDFEKALTTAGVEHEVVTYPGAPHSFFDSKRSEFADASADAWRRVLEFAERVSVPV